MPPRSRLTFSGPDRLRTMTDFQRTTIFRFVCTHCSHLNEYAHRHAVHVQPHLISSRCSSCQTLNWLGGLQGTVAETDTPVSTGATTAPETIVPPVAASPETV